MSCGYKKNQVDKTNEVQQEVKKENIVGGWTSIDVDDKVKEMAAFVTESKELGSKIEKITDASSQIVSGKNYRFKLHLENGEVWNSQVYENLQNEKQVTKFEKIN
ncbi:hypothetical protein BTO06_14535 [Tenacibaculum sp. SZ-18]|nr:hypothetical protein BTO06_14535 [Tenacibaculum sp. SZ-18]